MAEPMKCTKCDTGMMQADAANPGMMKCDKCGTTMKMEGASCGGANAKCEGMKKA